MYQIFFQIFTNKMTLAHIMQTENASTIKKWKNKLGLAFKKTDEEIKRKNISFSREEAIEDNLYD